jgi:hypothetical protein
MLIAARRPYQGNAGCATNGDTKNNKNYLGSQPAGRTGTAYRAGGGDRGVPYFARPSD